MKIVGLFLILIFFSGCSDSIPVVTALTSSFKPSKAQSGLFVDANIAGAKQIHTSDNYVGRFAVHSGTSGKTAQTADHYQLTIRKVSF